MANLLPITPGIYRTRCGGVRRVIIVGIDSEMSVVALSNLGTVSQRHANGQLHAEFPSNVDLVERIGDLP